MEHLKSILTNVLAVLLIIALMVFTSEELYLSYRLILFAVMIVIVKVIERLLPEDEKKQHSK